MGLEMLLYILYLYITNRTFTYNIDFGLNSSREQLPDSVKINLIEI